MNQIAKCHCGHLGYLTATHLGMPLSIVFVPRPNCLHLGTPNQKAFKCLSMASPCHFDPLGNSRVISKSLTASKKPYRHPRSKIYRKLADPRMINPTMTSQMAQKIQATQLTAIA